MENDKDPLIGLIDNRVDKKAPFLRTHLATVKSQSGNTVNVVFDDDILPGVIGVEVYTGLPGIRADVNPGIKVLIGFINGDPELPFALGFQYGVKAKNIEATATENINNFADKVLTIDGGTNVKLSKTASLPIARQNDAILAGTYPGTITAATAGSGKVLG